MPISSVRRIGVALALVASALAMVLVTPSTASAAPCVVGPEYSGTATIGVTPAGPVRPGEEITITGTGWPPGCDVVISVDGAVVGTVVTDANGAFSFGTTLGSSISGTVTIGATAGDFTRNITLEVAGRAPALTCNPSVLTFGDGITCTATGFPGNVAVTFAINPTLGTSDSNAEGTATITTTMPAQSTFDGPGCGPQTVTATGGGATASTSVTITCPTTPATTTAGSLPRTGSDSGRLSGIALALVAMGGLVVLAARRRSASAA